MAISKFAQWLEALGLRHSAQVSEPAEDLDLDPDGTSRPAWRSSSRVEAFLQGGSACTLDPDLAEVVTELGALRLAKSLVSKPAKQLLNQPIIIKEYASELVEIYRWQVPLQSLAEPGADLLQLDLGAFADRITSYSKRNFADNAGSDQRLTINQSNPQIWVFLDFQGDWEDRAMVERAVTVGRRAIEQLGNLIKQTKPELPIMVFPLVDPWAKAARITQSDAGDLQKQTAALHHQSLVAGEIANIASKQGCLSGLIFDSPVILRGEVDKAWILELSDSLGILVGYSLFGPLLEGSYPAELGELNPYLAATVQAGDLQRTRAKFDLVLASKPCGIRIFPAAEGREGNGEQTEISSTKLLGYLENLISHLDFRVEANKLCWQQIPATEVLIRLAQDIWNDFELPMAFYY